MILIPELKTIVILVPRTGSGSLRRALAARYPKSLLLYRHMEADGVPQGYDRWQKVGCVREPLDRLWSLYKFCQSHRCDAPDQGPGYVDKLRISTDRPFEDWLLRNDVHFTDPYNLGGTEDSDAFYPIYSVRHALPENRKSQFLYLRPDLGTEIYNFREQDALYARLGLVREHHENQTEDRPAPPLSAKGQRYVERVFRWDRAATA